MKLTPWFSAKKKPARKGWYQAMFNKTDGEFWLYWNGERWQRICGYTDDSSHVERPSTHQARFDSCFGVPTINRGEKWRGLAEKPE